MIVKKKPKSAKSLRRLIDYILNPLKTTVDLCGGLNCVPQNAYVDFMDTKKDYSKFDGINGIHFIQSFDPKESISPETARVIADRLTEFPQFDGFQIVYATHIDKGHIHNHFVINSVNSETGRKWHQEDKDLQALKDYSDKICLEFGLSIIEEKGDNRKSSGEYRAKQAGRSFRYELYLAVVNSMRCSNSQEDFINNMGKLGYGVKWEENRKYITFTTPDGKKCRNNKLYPPERFTKEALLHHFEYNAQRKTEADQNQKMDLLLSALRTYGSLLNASNAPYALR